MGRAYSKRRKKSNKSGLSILYCGIMLVMVGLFIMAVYAKAADLYQYKLQLAQARKEQEQVVEKNIELMKEISYQDTDAYMEKVARERLGLVKPNEIVYIDENK